MFLKIIRIEKVISGVIKCKLRMEFLCLLLSCILAPETHNCRLIFTYLQILRQMTIRKCILYNKSNSRNNSHFLLKKRVEFN